LQPQGFDLGICCALLKSLHKLYGIHVSRSRIARASMDTGIWSMRL
jgi:hypothetical protein